MEIFSIVFIEEEYIAVGLVSTAVNCFNLTEGPAGKSACESIDAEMWNVERKG